MSIPDIMCNFNLMQMVVPGSSEFTLTKSQGEGSPMDITNAISVVGNTYTDSSGEMVITRSSTRGISVVFKSGMILNLDWNSFYGNVWATIPRGLVTTSRGLMGKSSWQDCKFH